MDTPRGARPMPNARLIVLSAWLAVILAPPAASAHIGGDHENKEFRITFTCEGFGASIPIDAATVREEGDVPPEFHFDGEATGFTDVVVAGFYCSESTVDGEVTDAYNYSLVAVSLDSPHSGNYDIWQFLDLRESHARLSAFGVWSRLLTDMSVSVHRVGGVPVSGHADVPWAGSPYTIDAVMPGTIPLPDIPFPSDHWFSGPHGAVHAHHENLGLSVVPALVSVDTTPGTPLARVLGGDVAALPGLYLEFSGEAEYRAETDDA